MEKSNDETAVMTAPVTDLVTANNVIANLHATLAAREAELAAVRWGVEALIYGNYMPTSTAIARALNPRPEVVAAFRRRQEAG